MERYGEVWRGVHLRRILPQRAASEAKCTCTRTPKYTLMQNYTTSLTGPLLHDSAEIIRDTHNTSSIELTWALVM